VAAAAQQGVCGVRASVCDGTRFTFEVEARTPEAACEFVTRLFRSVYGLNWWADVASLAAMPTSSVDPPSASWN
jgi:hypothetical protein